MANHKSAIKRARQNEVRRLRNRGYKSRCKKAIKELRSAIDENSIEKAQQDLKEAVSLLQKTASRGVMHKNQASRKISRLTRQINQLSAS